jgi:hypothetical protein
MTLIIDEYIEKQNQFINDRENTLKQLEECMKKLRRQIDKFKISNTVGNSATIAGTIMVFIPFPLVQIAGTLLATSGTVTSLGTSIYKNAIENAFHQEFMEVLAKDEKSRKALLTAQHVLKKSPDMLKATLVATNLSKVANEATRVKEASRLLSQVQKVGKAPSKYKSFIKKIFKWGNGSKFGASFAAGMSVYDIVSTWTTTPASLEEMNTYIKILQADLENHKIIAELLNSQEFKSQMEVEQTANNYFSIFLFLFVILLVYWNMCR